MEQGLGGYVAEQNSKRYPQPFSLTSETEVLGQIITRWLPPGCQPDLAGER
jgi:hypothetical protein